MWSGGVGRDAKTSGCLQIILRPAIDVLQLRDKRYLEFVTRCAKRNRFNMFMSVHLYICHSHGENSL